MTWWSTGAGVLIVVLTLRDVFRTLWYPRGFGGLARRIFRAVWAVAGRLPRPVNAAGPVGMVLTSATWLLLLVLGFTLVYLPHMPQGFHFGSSLDPAVSSDLLASVYLSAVALTTLGLGDVVPADPWLRLVVPLQAVIGFVLLTAGISWVLQLYPALTRRRSLARRLSGMARQDAAQVVATGETSVAVQLLEGVREALAGVEMDLRQYGEAYYFRDQPDSCALAATLPYVDRLVAAGRTAAASEVRSAAAMLDDGLDAVAELVRSDFLPVPGSRADLLRAFARDHRHDPVVPLED